MTTKKRQRSNHPASNGSKWLRPDKRLAIYLRDGFLCAYCGRNLVNVPAAQRAIDHVVPISAGGTNDAANLCLSCKACNDRKQNKPARQYLWEQYHNAIDRFIHFTGRLETLLTTPLNRPLAKAIIAGTLDLSDVLKEQG